MKKIMKLVALFVILMVMAQAQLVYAAEADNATFQKETVNGEVVYVVTDMEKATIAESLADMFESDIYKATIAFPKDSDMNTLKQLIPPVYRETFFAYPEEANYRQYKCRMNFGQNAESIYCSFTFTELENGKERKDKAEESAKKFLDDLYKDGKLKTNMCQYQRARIIGEQLNEVVSYEIKDDYSGTAWSVFYRGTAHCQGYTSAYNLLLKLDGIKCKGITGNTSQGFHMWTVAELDGTVYQIDITWKQNSGLSKQDMQSIHAKKQK